VDGFFEVFLGQLQVVLRSNQLAVADPGGYGMQRMIFEQFCFARAPQILEQPWPKLKSRTEDDLLKRRSQILGGITVPGDDPCLTLFCCLYLR